MYWLHGEVSTSISAQSSHEFEVLSQPHQRKTALCFARARHAGGAPWSTRCRCFMAVTWHRAFSSSGREVQGKEALEDAECHWADFQIRSDAFQSNVGDEM